MEIQDTREVLTSPCLKIGSLLSFVRKCLNLDVISHHKRKRELGRNWSIQTKPSTTSLSETRFELWTFHFNGNSECSLHLRTPRPRHSFSKKVIKFVENPFLIEYMRSDHLIYIKISGSLSLASADI